MKLRPELLQHPNIPKPLHGMAPRVIKGQEWWDITRQAAYASTDYHCLACGVHKTKAKYHQWLEAHEDYTLDYENGVMSVKEIIPLCHSCHNFIHCGRLYMVNRSSIQGTRKIMDILSHGYNVLKSNNLQMNSTQAKMCYKYGVDYEACDVMEDNIDNVAQWSDWHLVLDGEKHYSRFKDMEEWYNHYSKRSR